ATMKRLNCTVRFVNSQAYEPRVKCEVIDLSTNEVYASALGNDRTAAAELALIEAEKAAKPLTPAQSVDGRYRRLNELAGENESLRAQIRDLESRLGGDAAASASPAALPPLASPT